MSAGAFDASDAENQVNKQEKRQRWTALRMAAVPVSYFLVECYAYFQLQPGDLMGLAFGGVGCALGTAVSMIIGNGLVMNWYYHRRIGLDMKYFWKNILGMFPAMFVPFALGFAAVSMCDFVGYSGVLLFAAPYALVFCAFLYRFGMNDSEREMVCGMVRKIVRR